MPRGYALVVGVAQYKNLDASKQLQFPESDAESMYRVLINHEGGAFPAENVHLLKGSQATLANIRRELEEWLPSVAQPADRVVVYFAGHGFVKDGKGYLAPWDVDPNKLDDDRLPDDDARRRAGQPRQGRLEGAADRRVPLRKDQRRDHQRGARAAVQRAAAAASSR